MINIKYQAFDIDDVYDSPEYALINDYVNSNNRVKSNNQLKIEIVPIKQEQVDRIANSYIDEAKNIYDFDEKKRYAISVVGADNNFEENNRVWSFIKSDKGMTIVDSNISRNNLDEVEMSYLTPKHSFVMPTNYSGISLSNRGSTQVRKQMLTIDANGLQRYSPEDYRSIFNSVFTHNVNFNTSFDYTSTEELRDITTSNVVPQSASFTQFLKTSHMVNTGFGPGDQANERLRKPTTFLSYGELLDTFHITQNEIDEFNPIKNADFASASDKRRYNVINSIQELTDGKNKRNIMFSLDHERGTTGYLNVNNLQMYSNGHAFKVKSFNNSNNFGFDSMNLDVTSLFEAKGKKETVLTSFLTNSLVDKYNTAVNAAYKNGNITKSAANKIASNVEKDYKQYVLDKYNLTESQLKQYSRYANSQTIKNKTITANMDKAKEELKSLDKGYITAKIFNGELFNNYNTIPKQSNAKAGIMEGLSPSSLYTFGYYNGRNQRISQSGDVLDPILVGESNFSDSLNEILNKQVKINDLSRDRLYGKLAEDKGVNFEQNIIKRTKTKILYLDNNPFTEMDGGTIDVITAMQATSQYGKKDSIFIPYSDIDFSNINNMEVNKVNSIINKQTRPYQKEIDALNKSLEGITDEAGRTEILGKIEGLNTKISEITNKYGTPNFNYEKHLASGNFDTHSQKYIMRHLLGEKVYGEVGKHKNMFNEILGTIASDKELFDQQTMNMNKNSLEYMKKLNAFHVKASNKFNAAIDASNISVTDKGINFLVKEAIKGNAGDYLIKGINYAAIDDFEFGAKGITFNLQTGRRIGRGDKIMAGPSKATVSNIYPLLLQQTADGKFHNFGATIADKAYSEKRGISGATISRIFNTMLTHGMDADYMDGELTGEDKFNKIYSALSRKRSIGLKEDISLLELLNVDLKYNNGDIDFVDLNSSKALRSYKGISKGNTYEAAIKEIIAGRMKTMFGKNWETKDATIMNSIKSLMNKSYSELFDSYTETSKNNYFLFDKESKVGYLRNGQFLPLATSSSINFFDTISGMEESISRKTEDAVKFSRISQIILSERGMSDMTRMLQDNSLIKNQKQFKEFFGFLAVNGTGYGINEHGFNEIYDEFNTIKLSDIDDTTYIKEILTPGDKFIKKSMVGKILEKGFNKRTGNLEENVPVLLKGLDNSYYKGLLEDKRSTLDQIEDLATSLISDGLKEEYKQFFNASKKEMKDKRDIMSGIIDSVSKDLNKDIKAILTQKLGIDDINNADFDNSEVKKAMQEHIIETFNQVLNRDEYKQIFEDGILNRDKLFTGSTVQNIYKNMLFGSMLHRSVTNADLSVGSSFDLAGILQENWFDGIDETRILELTNDKKIGKFIKSILKNKQILNKENANLISDFLNTRSKGVLPMLITESTTDDSGNMIFGKAVREINNIIKNGKDIENYKRYDKAIDVEKASSVTRENYYLDKLQKWIQKDHLVSNDKINIPTDNPFILNNISSELDIQNINSRNIVILDTETTGLTNTSEIHQFAYKQIKDKQTIVSEEILMSSDKLTKDSRYYKYQQEALEKGQTILTQDQGIEAIDKLLPDNTVMIAHNAKFDMNKIEETIERYNKTHANNPIRSLKSRNIAVLDTMAIAQNKYYLNDYKQSTLQRLFGIVTDERSHDALADINVLEQIFGNMQNDAFDMGQHELLVKRGHYLSELGENITMVGLDNQRYSANALFNMFKSSDEFANFIYSDDNLWMLNNTTSMKLDKYKSNALQKFFGVTANETANLPSNIILALDGLSGRTNSQEYQRFIGRVDSLQEVISGNKELTINDLLILNSSLKKEISELQKSFKNEEQVVTNFVQIRDELTKIIRHETEEAVKNSYDFYKGVSNSIKADTYGEDVPEIIKNYEGTNVHIGRIFTKMFKNYTKLNDDGVLVKDAEKIAESLEKIEDNMNRIAFGRLDKQLPNLMSDIFNATLMDNSIAFSPEASKPVRASMFSIAEQILEMKNKRGDKSVKAYKGALKGFINDIEILYGKENARSIERILSSENNPAEKSMFQLKRKIANLGTVVVGLDTSYKKIKVKSFKENEVHSYGHLLRNPHQFFNSVQATRYVKLMNPKTKNKKILKPKSFLKDYYYNSKLAKSNDHNEFLIFSAHAARAMYGDYDGDVYQALINRGIDNISDFDKRMQTYSNLYWLLEGESGNDLDKIFKTTQRENRSNHQNAIIDMSRKLHFGGNEDVGDSEIWDNISDLFYSIQFHKRDAIRNTLEEASGEKGLLFMHDEFGGFEMKSLDDNPFYKYYDIDKSQNRYVASNNDLLSLFLDEKFDKTKAFLDEDVTLEPNVNKVYDILKKHFGGILDDKHKPIEDVTQEQKTEYVNIYKKMIKAYQKRDEKLLGIVARDKNAYSKIIGQQRAGKFHSNISKFREFYDIFDENLGKDQFVKVFSKIFELNENKKAEFETSAEIMSKIKRFNSFGEYIEKSSIGFKKGQGSDPHAFINLINNLEGFIRNTAKNKSNEDFAMDLRPIADQIDELTKYAYTKNDLRNNNLLEMFENVFGEGNEDVSRASYEYFLQMVGVESPTKDIKTINELLEEMLGKSFDAANESEIVEAYDNITKTLASQVTISQKGYWEVITGTKDLSNELHKTVKKSGLSVFSAVKKLMTGNIGTQKDTAAVKRLIDNATEEIENAKFANINLKELGDIGKKYQDKYKEVIDAGEEAGSESIEELAKLFEEVKKQLSAEIGRNTELQQKINDLNDAYETLKESIPNKKVKQISDVIDKTSSIFKGLKSKSFLTVGAGVFAFTMFSKLFKNNSSIVDMNINESQYDKSNGSIYNTLGNYTINTNIRELY